MSSTGEIYLVVPKGYDSIADVYACFDSEVKAEAFMKRFKTMSDYQVITLTLNPEYYSHKYMDPYYIKIGKYNSEPAESYIADTIGEAEEAVIEKFETIFYENHGIERGHFAMYLFAADEKSAIEKVMAVRNAIIAQGEWLAAWERYRAKMSNLIIEF